MTTLELMPPRHDRRLDRFATFNREGGKFRVALLNTCNLDCFFCHNEGMANPRPRRRLPIAGGKRSGSRPANPLETRHLLELIDAFTRLGGAHLNLTGGEPLAHPELTRILGGIEKRATRVFLNTNAVLADRLLRHPRFEVLDGILASLHTTDDAVFRAKMNGRSARAVMANIVRLRDHGYDVAINYSLGPYNLSEFGEVLDFATGNRIPLKAIAFVRSSDEADFYDGAWVDPEHLATILRSRGGREGETRERLGGVKTSWDLDGTQVTIKNVARGRLVTDYCNACPHSNTCGEGIYGLRVGVDGTWKPCLLASERYTPVDLDRPWREQILDQVDAMVGDWSNARFVAGAPA